MTDIDVFMTYVKSVSKMLESVYVIAITIYGKGHIRKSSLVT
jgi:hypothetical protein